MAKAKMYNEDRDARRLKKLTEERAEFTSDEDKINRAKRLPSWEATDEEKMLYAKSIVPEGARVLVHDDLDEFNGVIIAGWLCDSKGVYYGICDGINHSSDALGIPGYSLCVSWEPTIEELEKYLKGTTLLKRYRNMKLMYETH